MPGSNQILPHFTSQTFSDRVIILNPGLELQGPDVVLSSDNTDAGSTPTYLFRKGNVVVLRTSTGEYVEANDANGDRNAAAAITTSGHSDGNGDIVVVGKHGTISVTTSTGSGTEANNATDLNADAAFAAHYVASSAAGELTITSRNVGEDEWFYIDTSTMATAGFAEGVGNGVQGTTADYRITAADASLQNALGTARDQPVANFVRGWFDESNLINLTAEARAVFVQRGSLFG